MLAAISVTLKNNLFKKKTHLKFLQEILLGEILF